MKITVLIENTPVADLIGEHGLSLLIHHESSTILLDAGSTPAFLQNAHRMNLPLHPLTLIVLSHGHYDHSGGLAALLSQTPFLPVLAQSGALDEFLSGSGGELHPIGVPDDVRAFSHRFHFLSAPTEILPRIHLVPHSTPDLAQIGARAKLYRQSDGALLPDDFAHEQSLVIETPTGLVIFNSCSHGGMQNIVREARAACGNQPVRAYVGGLHMKGKRDGCEICTFTASELDELADFIRSEGITAVHTGHCTGALAWSELKARLGDILQPLTTGMQFEL